MDISLEKTLPNNLEAERALLGAILLDNAMPSDAKPDYLYLDAHRKILLAMRELADNSRPIDIISLKDLLKIKNELEAVGGAAYLASLTDGVPNIALSPYYIKIIKRCAALRQLVMIGNETMARAYMDEDEPGEIIARLFDGCDGVNGIIDEGKGLRLISEIMGDVYQEIESRTENKKSNAYATGFYDLDRMMSGGVRPGDLGIVAGRPGHGKTAYTTKKIMNMARIGVNCSYFSIEMGAKALIERMIAIESRIPIGKLRTGFISRDEWRALSVACGTLSDLPIWIDDSSALSVSEMRSRIRKIRPKSKNGVTDGKIEVACVDYLQLMEAPDKFKRSTDENTQTAAISKGLKSAAKDMDLAVIAVSQLSRASEKRTDRRPQLSDLRNSGQIEQDADWVQFVYREEMGNPEEANQGKGIIILGKQRNGPIGDVTLTFVKDLASFENLYEEA